MRKLITLAHRPGEGQEQCAGRRGAGRGLREEGNGYANFVAVLRKQKKGRRKFEEFTWSSILLWPSYPDACLKLFQFSAA